MAEALTVVPHRNLESHIKRVLFVEPASGYSTGFNDTVRMESLGLEFLAGSVKDTVESTLLDLRTRRGQEWGVEGAISDTNPQMIALKCGYTTDVPVVADIARQIKKIDPSMPIIVGGHHISLSPEDLQIPEIDAIVSGPADAIFPDVIREAGKGRFDRIPSSYYQRDGVWVSNVPQRNITNLIVRNSPVMNERPKPLRKLSDPYRGEYYFLYHDGAYSVETAKGCRYRCSFCSVWQFHEGEYQVENWERTVEEINGLPNKVSTYVNIIDDLAIQVLPQDRDPKKGKKVEDTDSWKIAKALIESGNNRRFWMQCRADNIVNNPDLYQLWAEAGLDMILVGLESEDPADLKRVNKGSRVNVNEQAVEFLHSIGVKVWGAQILFADATEDRFKRLKEYNLKHHMDAPQFTLHTPLPGTVDWETYKDQLITTERRYFDFLHLVMPTAMPDMTIDRFMELYIDLYRSCHMSGDELNAEVNLGRITAKGARAFKRKFVHMLRLENFQDTIDLHHAYWAGELQRKPQ